MTPSEVLCKAADIIEEQGFHKGDLSQYNRPQNWGAACVVGAINTVISGNPFFAGITFGTYKSRLCAATYELLRDYISTPLIDEWNDAPERTKEEVIATLRKDC